MLEFVKAVNEWMWGLILLVILCGTGIFFTFRLKFIQVRKFGEGCRLVFGHFQVMPAEKERKEGEMTPFQSLATAIAAQVGTGNLDRRRLRRSLPEAREPSSGCGCQRLFWYGYYLRARRLLPRNIRPMKDGEVTGGPVYYIQAGL